MKTIKIIVALCFVAIFMRYTTATAQEMVAPYKPLSLFDDRVRITGFFDHIAKFRIHTPRELEYKTKSALNMFRTNFHLEAEYFAVRRESFELNFIGHFYFSYEWMFDLDSEYDDNFPTYGAHKFKNTKDEETIRELYAQFLMGSLDVRVGKQQVIWGEQLGIRTLDVVCPLDIRTEAIGLTEWENIRIGLWMLRVIYDIGEVLPGQLSFETLFIPSDYEPTQIPREGSFFGANFTEDGIPRNGYLTNLIDYRYYRDAKDLHHDGLKNAEWGLRVRGYWMDFDLDWSLVYFHTIDDGGVWADDGEGGHISADWFGPYNVARTTDDPPDRRVYDFKPYDVFGFSFQRYFGGFVESVVRLEFVYESNRDYNTQDNNKKDNQGRVLRRVVEKDSVSFGLQFSRKVPFPKIPYLYEWSRGKYGDFDIAINQLHWLDYDQDFGDGDSQNGVGYRLNGQLHGRGDNPVTVLSWMYRQDFLDSRIMFIQRGTLYLNSPSWQAGTTLSWRPGEHWAYSVGANVYTAKRRTDPFSGSETRDDITLKVSFMF